MMAPQEVYGGGLVLQHLTAQALSDTMTEFELIDRAREKGIQILAELYPCNYGGTMVGADYLHPDNYQGNMGCDYKDIIENASSGGRDMIDYTRLEKEVDAVADVIWDVAKKVRYGSSPRSDISSGTVEQPMPGRCHGRTAVPCMPPRFFWLLPT